MLRKEPRSCRLMAAWLRKVRKWTLISRLQVLQCLLTEQESSNPADDGGMEFTLDFPVEKATEKPAPAAIPDIGLAGINLNFDDLAAPGESAPEGSATGNKDDHWQEVATKLDLAKAYHEMGDASGAREILEEVLREGDTEQRDAAQNLIVLLG